MNLKKINKEVSPSYFKKGDALLKKSAVRELEEVEKNKFISFVDDEDDSFDVMLLLDPKNFDIIEHSCDCKETYLFCEHKVAVALHLKDRGKTAENSVAKKIRAKKVDGLRTFVDDVNEAELKDWVYSLIKSNKEIEHLFKNNFEKKVVDLTEQVVVDKNNEIIKAVMGKSKYADANNLQRIINLWQPYHDSLLDEIFLQEDAVIVEKLELLNDITYYRNIIRTKTSSNKLEKYQEAISKKVLLRLEGLIPLRKINIINLFVKTIEKNPRVSVIGFHLINTYLTLLIEKGKDDKIYDWIKRIKNERNDALVMKLMDAFDDSGNLKDYIQHFDMIPENGKFNLTLVNYLIKYEYLGHAEKIIKSIVRSNRNEHYNEPFYPLLKDIYLKQGNQDAYFEIVVKDLYINPTYEEYTAYISFEQDTIKLRSFNNRFYNALENKKGKKVYGDFYMKKYEEDKDYLSMIKFISTSYPLTSFAPFIGEMYKEDKKMLLHNLVFMKYDNYEYRSFASEEVQLWFEIMDKYFSKSEVSNVFTSKKEYTTIKHIVEAYLAD